MQILWYTRTHGIVYAGGINKTVTDPGVGVVKGVTLEIVNSPVPPKIDKKGSWTRYTIPGTYTAGTLRTTNLGGPSWNVGQPILEFKLGGDLSRRTDARTFAASATSGDPEIDEIGWTYGGHGFGDLASEPLGEAPEQSPWLNP